MSRKRIVSIIITFVLIIAGGYLGLSDNDVEKILSVIDTSGNYRVVKVDDGDTITVDMNGQDQTIRLIGVDTPETHHPSKPVQCFGQAATEFTRSLLEGEQVSLVADPLNSNRDKYQRLLRYVYTEENLLVNAEIIKQGYGFAYLNFNFTKLGEFEALENEARQNNRGLWDKCEAEVDSGFISTEPAN